ncbi:hypothetical protein QUF74_03125 [Candidatus Halobeggiatoa sp. HSG11]|nr:hypothetical protein [Candidatus Halobeggiatoa sp. HSG11]
MMKNEGKNKVITQPNKKIAQPKDIIVNSISPINGIEKMPIPQLTRKNFGELFFARKI